MKENKRTKKWLSILLAASFMAGILAGCGKAGQEPENGTSETGNWTANEENGEGENSEAKDFVIVTMPITSEPEAGFDPIYGWGAGEHVHEPLIQSTLLVTNEDLEIEKDLATDYQVSEDGLVWTVTIRGGCDVHRRTAADGGGCGIYL